MPRGYRYVILAAFGWLTLTGANHPYQHRERTETGHQTKPAQTAKATPTPAATATYAPYPDRYAEACYNASDHDTGDLCAQWRAAIAAEKAAHEARRATNWAIIATLLSFASLCGIIWSLTQTEGALGEARRGNRIAMKANARTTRQTIASATDTKRALELSESQINISKEASHREIRAYIGVDKISILAVSNESIYGKIFIKNDGATPAKVLSVKFRAFCAEFPIYEIDNTVFPIKQFYQYRPIINGGREDEYIFRVQNGIDGDISRAINSPSNYLMFVHGLIDYIDVFEQKQFVKFAYRVSGRLNGVDTDFCPLTQGNDAS